MLHSTYLLKTHTFAPEHENLEFRLIFIISTGTCSGIRDVKYFLFRLKNIYA